MLCWRRHATRSGRSVRGSSRCGWVARTKNLQPSPSLQALDAFEAWPGRDGRGHVVDSFWSAWDAFAGASDYRETVVTSVRYGNDTDTTAAIAGGLAGAYWGIQDIPAEWQRGLRDRNIPRELVDRLIETDISEWDGQPWRTSRMGLLRVDELDLAGVDAAGNGGRVGITFLPGKRYVGQFTGPHWRDLESDAARLRELGVNVLLVLVEDSELEQCRVVGIGEVLSEYGIEVVRFPIVDPRTPADPEAFAGVVAELLGRVRQGDFVAIACRGGLDRSGLAAACLLCEAGLDADTAIARVHGARSHSLSLPEQQAFVRAWRT
jgi:protein-tyrosine phosphatase